MKSTGTAVSWVVVLMAMTSLLSMVAMREIDRIVHNDLYRYGLQFSYTWATPYWTTTALVFAMGWFNIIAALSIQLYTVAFRRKEVEQLVAEVEKEISETESIPTQQVKEQEQTSKPTEAKSERTDKPVSVTESETPEKKEEKQTVTEEAQSEGKTESKPPEKAAEEKKDQGSDHPTEPTAEQREQEKQEEKGLAPEENDQTPILAGL